MQRDTFTIVGFVLDRDTPLRRTLRGANDIATARSFHLRTMRHHYIPQFLLRAWSETMSDGKVEVFRLDLPTLPSIRRVPKNTGYEDDLYALTRPIVAGMQKHAVEVAFLRHVDNLAARVRQKLVRTGLRSLSPTERCDWARFLMSLRLRQPSIVLQLRDETSHHLRQSLAEQPEQYEALAQDENAPTLECWVEERFPGLIENFGLSFFHTLVDDPNVGEHIVRMKWWLWDFANTNRELVLSDHPCIFTPGLQHPHLVIALPISPTKAFMATQDEGVAARLRGLKPKYLAMRLNESSLAQARAHLCSQCSAGALHMQPAFGAEERCPLRKLTLICIQQLRRPLGCL